MPNGHAWIAVATSRTRLTDRPGDIATLAELALKLLKEYIKEAGSQPCA